MPDSTPRIFISYARNDGEDFAKDMRRRLADIFGADALWRDRDRMEGGRDWWQQIVEALDVVEHMVLVATPAAMASAIVAKEWRVARQKGVCVSPVQVPGLPVDFAAMPRWMSDSHFYSLEREWETFVAYLTRPCEVPRVPFMAPDLPDSFVERPGPFEELKSRLLDPARQNPVALTTALQGAGGFGKTTLAAALCHDEDIQTAFDDGILWVTLGESPNVVSALTKLYTALADDEPNFRDEEEASLRLAEQLDELDCLMVIDDVWSSAHLRPFLRGGERTARLITTRDVGIAAAVRAALTEVDEMTADESIRLLGAGLDGADRATLSALAERLGEYAQMLEIANGMMRERIAVADDTVEGALAWLSRLLDRRGVLGVRRDDETARRRDIAGVLGGSLELLSDRQRRRLYELSIFKDDENIPLTSISRLWGVDDFDAEQDVLKMARLTLVKYSTATGAVRIHDVVREYLLSLAGELPALHDRLIAAWGDPHTLPDGYAWRYYAYHMAGAGRAAGLRDLLLDFRWLQARLIADDAPALVRDYGYFPHDAALRLVQSAIRLSLGALAADPRQLASQLAGRLFAHSDDADIATLLARVDYAAGTFESISADYPTHIQAGGALIRTLEGHGGPVGGALRLVGGRLLSWSADNRLRLWDADGALVRALEGHGAAIGGALELDGGRLLSWSNDNTLRLWEADGTLLRTLNGHKWPVNGARQLRDGRLLSWAGDHTLRLWDRDGEPLKTLKGHMGPVGGGIELRDGRLLSWSDDATLRLWAPDGERAALSGHESRISGAAERADGRLLSWADDHTLRLWDAGGGPQGVLRHHRSTVDGALELAGGRILSWSAESALLRLWTPDGTLDEVLRGHTEPVRGAALLRDGRFISWSGDRTLRLWGPDGAPLAVLEGHLRAVGGAVELDNGRLLSWSASENLLRLWEPDGTPIRALPGHTRPVAGAVELDGGRILSWSQDGTLRLWEDDAVVRMTEGHTGEIGGLLPLAGGRILSWSRDATLRLWDAQGQPIGILTGHGGPVGGALALADGRLLSWAADRTLRLWDADGELLCVMEGHPRVINGALELRDGRVLSWSGDGSLRLWDAGGALIRTLSGHDGAVGGAAELSSGRLLSWSRDRTLRLWKPDGTALRPLRGHSGGVGGAAELRDGRILSWSSDHTLRLWTGAGTEKRTLKGHTGVVIGALELRDGRLLSWSGDRTLRLWEAKGARAAVLKGHGDWIAGGLALSGGRLLSWSNDRTLRLWTPDGEPVAALTGHTGAISGAAELREGRLLSWSRDGSLRLWDADGAPLAAFYGDAPVTACAAAGDVVAAGDQAGRVLFLRPVL